MRSVRWGRQVHVSALPRTGKAFRKSENFVMRGPAPASCPVGVSSPEAFNDGLSKHTPLLVKKRARRSNSQNRSLFRCARRSPVQVAKLFSVTDALRRGVVILRRFGNVLFPRPCLRRASDLGRHHTEQFYANTLQQINS